MVFNYLILQLNMLETFFRTCDHDLTSSPKTEIKMFIACPVRRKCWHILHSLIGRLNLVGFPCFVVSRRFGVVIDEC